MDKLNSDFNKIKHFFRSKGIITYETIYPPFDNPALILYKDKYEIRFYFTCEGKFLNMYIQKYHDAIDTHEFIEIITQNCNLAGTIKPELSTFVSTKQTEIKVAGHVLVFEFFPNNEDEKDFFDFWVKDTINQK